MNARLPLIVFLLSACGGEAAVGEGAGPAAAAPAGGGSCCEEPAPAAGPLPGDSLYHVASTWTDQDGDEVVWSSLRGKPRVVAMIFTHCAYACPVILEDLQEIEAALPEAVRARTRFTLVSMDPERDTPEVLAAYADKHGLDTGRWNLLTSGPGKVRELAAALGVRYKKTASGDFSHSNLITVLDVDGRVVHRQKGLNSDPTETIGALVGLAQ